MYQDNNLANQIEKQHPAGLVEFLQTAGLVAASQGQSLHLVGGGVRDLLLERGTFDLDLVAGSNAINLAQQLADITGAKVTTHSSFLTANLKLDKWDIDIVTARSEIYARPGALPTVKPGSLEIDLFRRDFTINTMAIELVPDRWGEITDFYGGRDDLQKGWIRVLHEGSFIDDATRIWRALRYEQRLGFKLEPKTLWLLKRDTPMLETVSSDRIRHELELSLKEELPERVIYRAEKLKVLPELHPGLKGDGWLNRKFREARKRSSPEKPTVELYLALLAYRLTADETEKLISQLRLRKTHSLTLREGGHLKAGLERWADTAVAPSQIHSLLQGCRLPTITAAYLASDSKVSRRHINRFLTKLRYVKTSLSGKDLQKMGIPTGPQMKEILQKLLEARLDGRVKSKNGEREMVEGYSTE
ncbi:CCA tRNA nucleotidyltransferase [Chloroflexota bacterium]